MNQQYSLAHFGFNHISILFDFSSGSLISAWTVGGDGSVITTLERQTNNPKVEDSFIPVIVYGARVFFFVRVDRVWFSLGMTILLFK
jgi:hypothetical protein